MTGLTVETDGGADGKGKKEGDGKVDFAQLRTIQLRKLMFENGLLDPEDDGAVQSMTREQMIRAIEAFHHRGIPGLNAASGALQI